MNIFHLPDFGEGLAEAEIVEWHVAPGDRVAEGQPLVSVETDKAIVEVPSPSAGRIAKRYGEAGAVIHTGDPLVEFGGDARPDRGTVVGEMPKAEVRPSPTLLPGHERAAAGVRASPAVRALAQRLGVDLAAVRPSGPDALVTARDVQSAARTHERHGPLEPLRGVRRTMARNMARAHAEVVPVTLADAADIDAWPADADVTLRLVRALVAACRDEPALNAWFDAHAPGRRQFERVDVGIAVDTPDGLFVPVLRDAGRRDAADLRAGLERLKADVRARRIPPEELREPTITLSNFGMIAGRYSTPVVLPPTVAILGAGRIHDAVVAAGGAPAVHRMLPLSLTFDHRAVTGGEAGRFLRRLVEDLQRPG